MISKDVMQSVYDKIKTPHKLGAVIKSDEYFTDSPVVFRHGERWYMSFVRIDKKLTGGYETCLAVSDDLIGWTVIGCVLGHGNGWDSAQSGGYAQFIDNRFGGSNEIGTIGGKYAFAYIGGSKNGYETDPLSMGMALTGDISDNSVYERLSYPVLAPFDEDARRGETLTLYKPCMFEDSARTLGHRYVCAYNAKDETNRESIFLAVSDDGTHWTRHGDSAIIPVWEYPDDVRINGDPQIIMLDGLYVMVYFRYDDTGAYNTFAVSENLTEWKKWDGEPLIKSEYEWENVYAHKAWVVCHDGVVYHYYCAVNSQGERYIALATS